MSYGVGTLVKARGREWVVLPGSTEGLISHRRQNHPDSSTSHHPMIDLTFRVNL